MKYCSDFLIETWSQHTSSITLNPSKAGYVIHRDKAKDVSSSSSQTGSISLSSNTYLTLPPNWGHLLEIPNAQDVSEGSTKPHSKALL